MSHITSTLDPRYNYTPLTSFGAFDFLQASLGNGRFRASPNTCFQAVKGNTSRQRRTSKIEVGELCQLKHMELILTWSHWSRREVVAWSGGGGRGGDCWSVVINCSRASLRDNPATLGVGGSGGSNRAPVTQQNKPDLYSKHFVPVH